MYLQMSNARMEVHVEHQSHSALNVSKYQQLSYNRMEKAVEAMIGLQAGGLSSAPPGEWGSGRGSTVEATINLHVGGLN